MNTLTDLPHGISEATKRGRIQRESLDDELTRAEVEHGSIMISRRTEWFPNENGEDRSMPANSIGVTHNKGRRVDDAIFYESSPEWSTSQQLIAAGRKKVMKSDETLQKMIHSLQTAG